MVAALIVHSLFCYHQSFLAGIQSEKAVRLQAPGSLPDRVLRRGNRDAGTLLSSGKRE